MCVCAGHYARKSSKRNSKSSKQSLGVLWGLQERLQERVQDREHLGKGSNKKKRNLIFLIFKFSSVGNREENAPRFGGFAID